MAHTRHTISIQKKSMGQFGEDYAPTSASAAAAAAAAAAEDDFGMEEMSPDEAAASVSMQFCSLCNNLLFPTEDPVNKKLKYRCRACSVEQSAASACVMRREVKRDQKCEQPVGEYDVGSDPTLPRTKIECLACGHDEAAYFQSYGTGREATMTVFLVCCNAGCNYKWAHEPESLSDDDDEA